MRHTLPTRLRTTLGAVAVATATAVAVPAGPARAAVDCTVDYTASTWDTGFSASVQVKNLGDTWTGYTVEFRFTAGQQLTSTWSHHYTQDGDRVTVRNADTAQPVRTGETLWLGFLGSHTGENPPPVDWRVNGVACTDAHQPPAVIAEPTAVSVPEGHGAAFRARLSHPPAGPVTLQVRSQGTGIWAAPPVVLVFTPTNWNTPQGYTVTSFPDGDDVDDVLVLTLSVPGYSPATVTFTQIDADRVR